MIRHPHTPTFGAVVAGPDAVEFRVWAPAARRVRLHLRRCPEGQVCLRDLAPDLTPERQSADLALWRARVDGAKAGDRYAYAIDDGDPKPDPASRFQPDGVHAWSEIVDPAAFHWTDGDWRGLDPRRTIVYELHVGTFTPEGTFASAAAKLPYLADLGVTAIELMPLADFAGARNWGYDGVALFAPSRAYGRPGDLRAFVNAAHRAGLAVLIDTVYNHLGPEGAYLPSYSAQFLTDKHRTPWGGAVNLDDRGSTVVRDLLRENALHWIHEYHADGLRLDATHSLFDSRQPHFVAELTRAVHGAADPRPLVYAEDHRNLADMVDDSDAGWGLDGVWADDFHHVIRRMLAGDDYSYFRDYQGTAGELAATLRQGWLYVGQPSIHEAAPRGTDPSRVPMRKAVVCVQNHDQIGNRAMGDRLHHTADPAAWRAAVTVLLTSPMTPLLFMGQEWGASTPFQFFTDFEPDLGQKVVEGRRREFRAFPEFSSAEGAERIPAPQSEDTFLASRLRWAESSDDAHAPVLRLHRTLLRLRNERRALQASDACECAAEPLDGSTVSFRREAEGEDPLLIVARLQGHGTVSVPPLRDGAYQAILDTEDREFAPDGRPPVIDAAAGAIEFARPGALVFAQART